MKNSHMVPKRRGSLSPCRPGEDRQLCLFSLSERWKVDTFPRRRPTFTTTRISIMPNFCLISITILNGNNWLQTNSYFSFILAIHKFVADILWAFRPAPFLMRQGFTLTDRPWLGSKKCIMLHCSPYIFYYYTYTYIYVYIIWYIHIHNIRIWFWTFYLFIFLLAKNCLKICPT